MDDREKIIKIFSYSEKERETFPFLEAYMSRIQDKLPMILENPRQCERFILAGLFLTYRASNHTGIKMTTEISDADLDMDDIHTVRLVTFKEITGKSIDGIGDYLKMIGQYKLFLWMLMRSRNPLYGFVMRGW